jgi:uncharacterized membrane protein
MRWGPVARAAPFVVYPLIVYLALEHVEVRYLGLALLFVLLLRYRGSARRLARGMDRWSGMMLIVVACFVGAVWWSNDELLLRLYPALLNGVALVFFGHTLFYPPSMIERFARLQGNSLSAESVRYTERVTWVWCGFFLGNGLAAAYTALYSTREVWALYNGLLAYCLMGVLFAGEWLVRRRYISREPAP